MYIRLPKSEIFQGYPRIVWLGDNAPAEHEQFASKIRGYILRVDNNKEIALHFVR